VKYYLAKIRNNWESCVKSTLKMLNSISKESVEDSVSSIQDRRVGGLSCIREEASFMQGEEYIDSIEAVKQQQYDKSHPFITLGFGMAVRVFIESKDFEMAVWASSFIEDTSYEKALLNLKKDNDTMLLESLVESAEAQEILAIHEWEKGNIDKALVYCKYCLKLDGRRKAAWELMGKIKYKLGSVEESIECLQKAAETCDIPFSILSKTI
jgi:tetratricopeptide (TPR) repeat protein